VAHRAVAGDRDHHRVDVADEVRPARCGVVVRGVVERLDGRADRAAQVRRGVVQLLERTAGEHRAGADRVEAQLLLVAAAGGVERDDPPGRRRVRGVRVVPGEQRDDDEALQGGAEVPADHRGQLVRLAVERQRHALDLLVVLELDGEQPHHLDRDAGRPGDPDGGERVGDEHLLDVALGRSCCPSWRAGRRR
jgi:hypothetical protein